MRTREFDMIHNRPRKEIQNFEIPSAQIIIKNKGESRVKKGKMGEDGGRWGKRLPLGGGLAAPPEPPLRASRGAPPPEPPGNLYPELTATFFDF